RAPPARAAQARAAAGGHAGRASGRTADSATSAPSSISSAATGRADARSPGESRLGGRRPRIDPCDLRLRGMTGENGLDGIWDVQRTGGALPPMRGIVHKRIENGRGWTIAAGVRFPFVVVGLALRYPFGLVDELVPD